MFFKKSPNFHIYRYIGFVTVTFKYYRNVEDFFFFFFFFFFLKGQ